MIKAELQAALDAKAAELAEANKAIEALNKENASITKEKADKSIKKDLEDSQSDNEELTKERDEAYVILSDTQALVTKDGEEGAKINITERVQEIVTDLEITTKDNAKLTKALEKAEKAPAAKKVPLKASKKKASPVPTYEANNGSTYKVLRGIIFEGKQYSAASLATNSSLMERMIGKRWKGAKVKA